MSAASAITPLQSVLNSAPLAECLSADFKKRTVTFRLEAQQRAEAGSYFLVPAVVGQLGMAQEQFEAALTLKFPSPGKLRGSFNPHGKDLILEVTGDGYEHTFYRCRPTSRDSYTTPDHWSGHLTRKDSNGTGWTCCTGDYVTDDFGSLVKVSS